jgi:drug/metabolite transporter (DMT)-like permease
MSAARVGGRGGRAGAGLVGSAASVDRAPALPTAAARASTASSSASDWWRGVPVIALSSLFFASMAVLAKAVRGALSPGQLVLARFVVGLAVMAGWFAWRREWPLLRRPLLLAMRGLLGGGAVYFYFVAIDHLQVGPATVLNYTSPVFAAAFAASFLGERVSRSTLAGMGCAIVGATLVVWTTLDPSKPLTLGVGAWAGVVAAVFGGGAQTAIRALRKDTDAATVFFAFCLFGLLWALPFALADWRPVTPAVVAPALAVGLLSAVAQVLFTYGFGYTTAAVGSATTQLTPALSWGMAVALLAEPLHPVALAGALLCTGGVLWGTQRRSGRTLRA